MSRISGKHDLPFYENPKAHTYAGRMSLIGCILMVAAAFLHWKFLFVRYTETKLSGYSIFSSIKRALDSMIVRDYDGNITEWAFSFQGILPIALLVVYILYVLFMAILGFMDHIKERDIFDKGYPTFLARKKKTVRFILVIGLVIISVLLTHTKMFTELANDSDQLYNNWVSMIDLSKNSGVSGSRYMLCIYKPGPGCIGYFLGLGLYVASIIYRFVVDTLNEDA